MDKQAADSVRANVRGHPDTFATHQYVFYFNNLKLARDLLNG